MSSKIESHAADVGTDQHPQENPGEQPAAAGTSSPAQERASKRPEDSDDGTAALFAAGAGDRAAEVARHYFTEARALQLTQDSSGQVEIAKLPVVEDLEARARSTEPGEFKCAGCKITWTRSKMPLFLQFTTRLKTEVQDQGTQEAKSERTQEAKSSETQEVESRKAQRVFKHVTFQTYRHIGDRTMAWHSSFPY